MRDRDFFEEFQRFFDRMSEQFEETADWPMPMEMRRDAAVDVVDIGDVYEVRVELPGFRKEDVELTLSDGTMRVRAEREVDDEDVRYVRRERHRGTVDRTVNLPDAVDEDAADATLADGLLTVTVAKEATGEDATAIDIE